MNIVLYITLLAAGLNIGLIIYLDKRKKQSLNDGIVKLLFFAIVPYLIVLLVDSSLNSSFRFKDSKEAMYAIYLSSMLALTIYLIRKGWFR